MRTWIVVALALGAGLFGGCGGEGESSGPVLRFSALPEKETSDLEARLGPFARHLSHVLDVRVDYVPANDVDALVKKLTRGEIQLVWLDGVAGIRARDAVPGASVIAQGAGDPRRFSYLVAHRSTGLEYADEFPLSLRDLSFTFGARHSTSGRVMPEFFIRQQTGLEADGFFRGEPRVSRSHESAIERVAAGKIDVGAVDSRIYDEMVVDGRVDPDACRVIWKSPPYHGYGFTVHPDVEARFGPGFVDRLRDALLGVTDRELLEGFGRIAFIPAAEADYTDVVEAARQVDPPR